MKKRLMIFVLFIIAVCTLTAAAETENNIYKFYVSASGSDSADGTIENPFRTIERARSEVRDLRENGIDDNALIILRQGNYFRFRSFKMTEKDYNMSFEAYPNETVTVSGGLKIPENKISSASDTEIGNLVTDDKARQNLKEADLNDLYRYCDIPKANGSSPIQLYGGGKPYELSTYPDKRENALMTESIINDNILTYTDDTDRQLTWSDKSVSDMYVFGHISRIWGVDFKSVSSFSKSEKKAELENIDDKISLKESGFLLCNIPEEINSPGEYYIDRENKKAYFYPYDESDLSDMYVSIINDALITSNGSKNITFKNINFGYSRYNLFYIKNSDGFTFDNCSFKHFAEINEMTSDGANIKNCTFYDGTRGGVIFNGGDTVNLTGGRGVIKNSTFDSLSRLHPTGRFGVFLAGFENTIRNCELKNSDYSLLSAGGIGSKVIGNKIHDGTKWVSDMGAVYYGIAHTSVGTEFYNNIFYDNYSDYGSTASVYWDDRSVGPYIHDNLFYVTDIQKAKSVGTTGLKSNAGVFSTVENNTFVNLEPMKHEEFNFDMNKHAVFWLLCNSKPTLSAEDRFKGWWENIEASGYFGAWQNYFKGTLWERYTDMLTRETHDEVKNVTDQNELLKIAEKYAPSYGINSFKHNVVFNSDENSENFASVKRYNTVEDNFFTNDDSIFNSYESADYGIPEQGWETLLKGRNTNVSAKLKVENNKVTVYGIAKKNIVTIKITQDDNVIFMEQKFIVPDEMFKFECMTEKTNNIKAAIKCGNDKWQEICH